VTARLARTVAWCLTGALVVLASRAVAYALAPPTLLSLELQRSAGGPRLVVISVVAIGIALAVSVSAVGIAALALRERAALDPALAIARPRLRPACLLLRVSALWAATCLCFAYLESYLHWRQGLGWHGLHCLVGPVHRDAIPILGALSVVGVALRLCVEHVIAWTRRTIRRLLARPPSPVVRAARQTAPAELLIPGDRVWSLSRPRGPPRYATAYLS